MVQQEIPLSIFAVYNIYTLGKTCIHASNEAQKIKVLNSKV